MRSTTVSSTLLAACVISLLHTAPALAQTTKAKATAAAASSTQADPIPVYGSQLMTERERTAYRARVWAAKTDEERNRIRAEHHEEMKLRAKEKGLTLPDAPPSMPAGGPGMGGARQGRGMMAGAACPAASVASASGAMLACEGAQRGMGHHRHHRHGGGPMNRP